ncbi:potassium channel family protein [Iodobacter ciconiae]|nr:potassium channel family protein [Iodobacter ciconiae]
MTKKPHWRRITLYALLLMFLWPWLLKLDLLNKSGIALQIFIAAIYLNYLSFVFSIAQGQRLSKGISPAGAVCLFLFSNMLLIFMFAVGWQRFALFGPGGSCLPEPGFLDSLYFSTTTFATVGFGDFIPCNRSGKILLMAESLIGSTHFGIFITLIFSRVIYPPQAESQ